MDSFSEFKEEAVENQPRFYRSRLKNFRLESSNEVMLEGKKFPLSDEGLNSIRDFVQMPKRFSNRMSKNLGDDATISLMDALRKSKAGMNDDKQIFVVFNSDSNEVRAVNDYYPRLTREGYFDLVERVIDEYGLNIVGFSEDEDQDILRVKTEKKGEKVRLADVENEVFRAGPTFVSQLGSLAIHSFMMRMVCTNGAIARREDQDFQAKLNREDMTEFFEYLNELAENNFVPEGFRENAYAAMNHAASLDEMQTVRGYMRSVMDENPTMESTVEIDRFLDYNECVAGYHDIGVNIDDLTRREKRNAPANVTMWELMNNLTSFATHDPLDIGFDESDGDYMITKAGELLSKKFDTANLPPQPNFHLN